MKFEDVYNATVVAIGIACFAHEGYKAYAKSQDKKAEAAANDWRYEAGARLNTMIHYAKMNHISKAAYVEALEAAKNVLSFEVDDVLPGNVHSGPALRKLLAVIDKEIANV